MKLKSKILVIAGSDSSGGAGIQADIKTITSLGSYAMTAITAITSQNTTGVLSISKVPINEIKRQIEFTSKDIRPDAIKIGMLHSKKVIETVINSLKKIKVKKDGKIRNGFEVLKFLDPTINNFKKFFNITIIHSPL